MDLFRSIVLKIVPKINGKGGGVTKDSWDNPQTFVHPKLKCEVNMPKLKHFQLGSAAGHLFHFIFINRDIIKLRYVRMSVRY